MALKVLVWLCYFVSRVVTGTLGKGPYKVLFIINIIALTNTAVTDLNKDWWKCLNATPNTTNFINYNHWHWHCHFN